MPATEIYLIRHGQTDYNRQFRLQGRSDIPLNRLGLAQARAAHEALRGVHFDAVYASPLRRAVDTACIVSGWPEEKIELDPRLIEIGFGIWEGSDFRTLGPALNALYLQIKGLPLSLFWTHRFGNCSIVRLGLSGGRLSVLEEYPEPVAPA